MCEICEDGGWICEVHPNKTWESGGNNDCDCGGAGEPCKCNPRGALPPGFRVICSIRPTEIYTPKE